MNSGVDKLQDFVKINVQPTTDTKDKQVTFTYQLPSQTTANARNQEASLSQKHNINHVHVDEEAVKMMTRRDRVVIDFTRSRVKNKA